jgi:hypothetical protein
MSSDSGPIRRQEQSWVNGRRSARSRNHGRRRCGGSGRRLNYHRLTGPRVRTWGVLLLLFFRSVLFMFSLLLLQSFHRTYAYAIDAALTILSLL